MTSAKDVPLSTCTYMKVGGLADEVKIVTTIAELKDAVQNAQKNQTRFFILGSGSNTLFTDKGFRGTVIINRASGITIDKGKNTIIAESGLPMNLLVNESIKAGLEGLEDFLGIPGTVGGAIYNNSHHLDKLIGDYVTEVELLETTGETTWVSHDSLGFAYDYSNLQNEPKPILRIKFGLKPGDQSELQQKAVAALKRRRATQPLEMPSSGCMFKNFKNEASQFPKLPQGITSAGALIDTLGLKNKSVGGAQISQVHANFIVNTGKATTQNVIDLSNKIIEIVKSTYGLTLKREVFIVNEMGERTNT